ncbi:MAG: sulfatase [Gemmatimonadota bacterium]
MPDSPHIVEFMGLRESETKAAVSRGSDAATVTWADTILISIWAGLIAGIIQVLWVETIYRHMHAFLGLGRERFWAIPLGSTVVALAAGLLLIGAASATQRRVTLRLLLGLNISLAALGALLLLGGFAHIATLLLAIGIGLRASPRASRHPAGVRRLVRRSLIPITVFVAVVGGGIRVARALQEQRALAALPVARPDSPNVILLILDTVRADELSAYGYARSTSPALTRLAARGIRFEWAISPASWTLPSHATMLTGRWPHEHRASWKRALGPEFPTLAEVLADHGYATAGFVANPVIATESGIARGFAHFEDEEISVEDVLRNNSLFKLPIGNVRLRRLLDWYGIPGRIDADEINAKVLHWMDRHPARPFFTLINYLDAHAPYVPPVPFDTMFGPVVARQDPLLDPSTRWSDQGVRAERDSYDRSIAYLDNRLGALMDSLDHRGLLRNTLVIITADHGEEFREHGSVSHGNNLYLPTVHVPLIMSMPGRVPAGGLVSRPVSLRDLPATILDLLAIPGAHSLPGHGLEATWRSSAGSVASDTVLSEVTPYRASAEALLGNGDQMRALTGAELRYVVNGDGREELYEYPGDSLEQRDLTQAAAQQVELEQFRRTVRAVHPKSVRP